MFNIIFFLECNLVKCSNCIDSRDNCTECSHLTQRNISDSCNCSEGFYDNNTIACDSKYILLFKNL